MFDAVIFDFDGVIVDSEQAHFEACHSVFAEKGINFSRKQYQQQYIGFSDHDMFPRIFADAGKNASYQTIESMIAEKINIYRIIITQKNQVPTVKGLYAFVNYAIEKKKRIGICSAASKREVIAALNKLYQDGLPKCFETVVTANDVSFTKPHPDPYLLVADNLMVEPKKCLVIEDSPTGIESAKGAGMHVAALTTSYQNQLLQQADLIVHDFDELLSKALLD
ncbi:MAG: HAD family phosphatase [Gammaproteobacteria bacterium]|nr:HAD family phosphatase [Gammaproteobacteria bacterium]